MITNRIAEYYNKQVLNIEKYFYIIFENYNEEAIHSFRLACKHMNAVYKLIKDDKKINKTIVEQKTELDEIYKNTGRIREIQIDRMLINQYIDQLIFPFTDYLEYLDNESNKAKSLLKKQIKNINIANISIAGYKIYTYINKFNENGLRKKGLKLLSRKAEIIEKLIYDSIEEEKFHSVRKNIKEAYFILKLLYRKEKYKEYTMLLNQMKNLETILGEWHDNDIMLINLYTFLNINKNTNLDKLENNYKILIETIISKKKNLIENIETIILKANLRMICFNGIKQIELIKNEIL